MAAAAETDSWNPTERTSSGSTTSRPVTARASTRTRETGPPTVAVVTASAAIAAARSTDGSNRVVRPNIAITSRRGAESRPEPQPPKPGGREGQHEGDVLARHGQQVGEAGAQEVVGQLHRLLSVVADHEPRVERALHGCQRSGAARQRPPQPVGEARWTGPASHASTA